MAAATVARRRTSADRASLIAVFLGLPFAVYLGMVVYPFSQAAWYSLTGWTGFSPEQPFVGLDNYVRLAADDRFGRAVANSVTLLVVVPVVTLTLAFALACAVTFGGRSVGGVQGLRGSSVYRVVSFFPYVVPAIVVGIIWSQVYDPSSGLLNGILRALGADGSGVVWLGEPSTAMAASVAVIVWSFVGFYTVVFVAALRGVPSELFEAARLDGAGRFRTALSVALPGVTGTVRSAYVYMGILALDAFVYFAALNPDGGPENSTLVITQEIYQTAFRRGQFGLACAMGVVLALLTFVFVGLVSLAGALHRRAER